MLSYLLEKWNFCIGAYDMAETCSTIVTLNKQVLLKTALIYAHESIFPYRFYGVIIKEYMICSEYQGIDRLVSKRAFIRTYKHIGVHMDDRATKTIIFDQGICKNVRVTAIMIFYQVWVTDYSCNWPLFNVELMQVTIPALANTSKFYVIIPTSNGGIPLILILVNR